jgi:predicted  nucleic acid-binding Zn-ribbon protein
MSRLNAPLTLVLVAAALVVATARPQLRAEPASKPTAPETVYAERVITLGGNVDVDALVGMLDSAASLAANVVGVPHERAVDLIKSEFTNGDRLTLSVSLPPDKFPPDKRRASEFVDKVVSGLASQLGNFWNDDPQLRRAHRDVDEAEQKVERWRQELKDIEQKIREITGRSDVDADAIRASVPKLEDERQELRLTVIGKEARQKALTEAIEKLSKAAAARASDDPVAAELEKVVTFKERARDRLRQLHEQGVATNEETAAAEAPIAEARARLLERREAVKQSSGGEMLSGMNRELATISIDVAEAQAKLKAIDELLARYDSARGAVTSAEIARREKSAAEADLQKARESLQDARSRIPAEPLRVLRSTSKGPDDPSLKPDTQPDK